MLFNKFRLICDPSFVDKNCKDKVPDGKAPDNKNVACPNETPNCHGLNIF